MVVLLCMWVCYGNKTNMSMRRDGVAIYLNQWQIHMNFGLVCLMWQIGWNKGLEYNNLGISNWNLFPQSVTYLITLVTTRDNFTWGQISNRGIVIFQGFNACQWGCPCKISLQMRYAFIGALHIVIHSYAWFIVRVSKWIYQRKKCPWQNERK